MHIIDLAKLAGCSKGVTATSFGGVSPHGARGYTSWLKSKLRGFTVDPSSELPPPVLSPREKTIRDLMAIPTWETQLDSALEAAWRVEFLMPGGPEEFAGNVSKSIIQQRELTDDRPIYPVINSAWKSDAWLTGLFLYHPETPSLNIENIGFALSGTPNPEPAQKITLNAESYDLLYVDDASYSGTQAFNIMNSIFFSGLRPKRVLLMFAGISKQALQQISQSPLFTRTSCKLFIDEKVTTLINANWNITLNTRRLLQAFFNYQHIEADPKTNKPKPTKGEFPIFTVNCLVIPPYKIPDSLSVPTHLFLGCTPDCQFSVFEFEGGHIFLTNGGVNYRDVMTASSEHYAQLCK
ncbi:hypothetical protein EI534_13110 [Pseudomonas frederiksbergensis]|nr:hypothetical protein [Pseudomonas frederiksbergensis]